MVPGGKTMGLQTDILSFSSSSIVSTPQNFGSKYNLCRGNFTEDHGSWVEYVLLFLNPWDRTNAILRWNQGYCFLLFGLWSSKWWPKGLWTFPENWFCPKVSKNVLVCWVKITKSPSIIPNPPNKNLEDVLELSDHPYDDQKDWG